MGRSPDPVEDQITYPIITARLSAPNVTVVGGFPDFGYSYVYVLVKDGTDIFWARSRMLEYLNQLSGRLPEGVTPDDSGGSCRSAHCQHRRAVSAHGFGIHAAALLVF